MELELINMQSEEAKCLRTASAQMEAYLGANVLDNLTRVFLFYYW